MKVTVGSLLTLCANCHRMVHRAEVRLREIPLTTWSKHGEKEFGHDNLHENMKKKVSGTIPRVAGLLFGSSLVSRGS